MSSIERQLFRFAVSAATALSWIVGVAIAQQPEVPIQVGSKQATVESDQGKPATSSEWRIAPIYFWAPINSTTASEGEGAPPVDVTQGQTGLNAALAARAEFQKGRWLASVQELYASIGYDSTDASGIHSELDFKMSLLELYGGREIGHDFNIFGGVRHYSGRLSFTSTRSSPIDQDDSLTDPVVGVSYRPRLSKSWTLAISADVGGFGVGFDRSSCGTAVFTWRSGGHLGADVGYRALYMRKEDPASMLKTTFYGPVFGFEVFF